MPPAIWQAGHRDAILDDHEKRIHSLEVSSVGSDKRAGAVDALDERVRSLEVTVSKQGEITSTMNETLARIDERLKFLIDQFGKGNPVLRKP